MFAKPPVRQMSDYTQTLDSEDKRTATRVAALDIGSNSFHLVVARIVANDVQILHRLKMKVQLARGLDADNWLSDEAIARGVDYLRMINESLGDFEPDSVRAVATFTLRQARNARQFLTAARDVFPYPIEIIRGMEEARLIYQGVAHTQHAEGRRMVVDIGGGSTELILGDGFDPIALTSLQMGCVTFTNRFFRNGEIKQKQFDKAITATVQIMEIAPEQFHELDWEQTLGSSGSIRAVTEQAMAMSGGAGDRHVTRKQIKELVSLCVSAGHVDELPFEDISEERRRVFPAGLAILKGIFDAIDIKELMYSPAALREGVIYDMDNNILGTHDGISNYTIGQRKGIGISGSREPLYVIEINKSQNSITLGTKEKLKKNVINFQNINWLGGNIVPQKLDCSAKIRSTQEDLPGILNINSNHGTFTFEKDLDNTSPGQACVFYKNDQLLGGGWITA